MPSNLNSEDILEELDDLKKKNSRIAREMEVAQREFSEFKYDQENFQLKYPLDPVSRHIIKSSVVIPITVINLTEADRTFFTADRPFLVQSIVESHSSTSVSGTIQLRKSIAGQTTSLGVNLLSSTFNLFSAANTAQARDLIVGGLTTAISDLVINRGDRLSLISGGSMSGLSNFQATIYLVLI